MSSKALGKFNPENLDAETAYFVQQQAVDIRKLLRRTAQDVYEIGQKLLLVKDRLKHGDFSSWLAEEFDWSSRTAQQFMNVARYFKSENFSDLDFTPSALSVLAAPSTPLQAREAAIKLARAGEPITVKKAKEIKQKYIDSEATSVSPLQTAEITNSASITANICASQYDARMSYEQTPGVADDFSTHALPTGKHEIIAVYTKDEQPQPRNILTSKAWWFSSSRHFLYNGDSQSFFFENHLPKPVSLMLVFPDSRNEWPQSIPNYISSIWSIWTPYNDEDLSLLSEMVERALLLYTSGGDTIVFRGVPAPSLLKVAHNLDLQCYVAEPSFKNCIRLIDAWRSFGETVHLVD